MKKVVKYAKKFIYALIGVPLFVVGLILIPLPGPGLVICFIALYILAQEFEWARPHLEKSKKHLSRTVEKAKARADKISKKSN